MQVTVPLQVAIDVGTPTTCVPAAAVTERAQRRQLFEIFLAGPLMVWGGVKAGGFAGSALAMLGLGTMAFGVRGYSRARTQSMLPSGVTAPDAAPPAAP